MPDDLRALDLFEGVQVDPSPCRIGNCTSEFGRKREYRLLGLNGKLCNPVVRPSPRNVCFRENRTFPACLGMSCLYCKQTFEGGRWDGNL
jgi:hypothetical protein